MRQTGSGYASLGWLFAVANGDHERDSWGVKINYDKDIKLLPIPIERYFGQTPVKAIEFIEDHFGVRVSFEETISHYLGYRIIIPGLTQANG